MITSEDESEMVRAVHKRGDDCVHNFAPLFRLTKRIVCREIAKALRKAAEEYSDFEVYLDVDGDRSMRQHGLTTPEWLQRRACAYLSDGQS